MTILEKCAILRENIVILNFGGSNMVTESCDKIMFTTM